MYFNERTRCCWRKTTQCPLLPMIPVLDWQAWNSMWSSAVVAYPPQVGSLFLFTLYNRSGYPQYCSFPVSSKPFWPAAAKIPAQQLEHQILKPVHWVASHAKLKSQKLGVWYEHELKLFACTVCTWLYTLHCCHIIGWLESISAVYASSTASWYELTAHFIPAALEYKNKQVRFSCKVSCHLVFSQPIQFV